jgi:branched-chain amino acid transport system substrate-binding protein
LKEENVKKTLLLLLAIGLFIALVLNGCGGSTSPTSTTAAPPPKTTSSSAPTGAPPASQSVSPASGTIKIGVLIPLTGALQHEGPADREGLQLALKDYGNTVAGKNIQLIFEDDATDATTALDKARKLVESDGVSMIIGPQFQAAAAAVQPYLTQKKIICFKLRQMPMQQVAQFPYFFAPEGTQAQVTYPMGTYAFNVLKYKTVATGTDDFIGGRAFMSGFEDGFKDAGGQIIQQQYWPNTTVDFSSYLANVKTADAFCAWTGGPGGAQMIKQFKSYGLDKKMPLMAAYISGILNEDVLPTVGDDALGIMGPSDYASTIDNPINKKVVAEYQQTYNKRPADSGIGGYIDMQTALEALKATNGNTDPDTLKAALTKLSFDCPNGHITIGENKMGTLDIVINKIAKDNTGYFWQVIYTYNSQKPR